MTIHAKQKLGLAGQPWEYWMSAPLDINRLSLSEIVMLQDKGQQSSVFKQDIVCPIDSEHIIDIKRLDVHIADCRRRNAHLGQTKCQHNCYHYTRPEILRAHLTICPDRNQADSPSQTKQTREGASQSAVLQIVELKLQCGLPITEREMEMYKTNKK